MQKSCFQENIVTHRKGVVTLALGVDNVVFVNQNVCLHLSFDLRDNVKIIYGHIHNYTISRTC